MRFIVTVFATMADLPVSNNVKLINQRDLSDVKEYTGSKALLIEDIRRAVEY